MTFINFSLPDGDAEFEVEHFQAAGSYRWNEPPETGEITLKSLGTWAHIDSDHFVDLTIEDLVKLYMFYYGLDEAAAARRIEDEAYEKVIEQWEDRYEERD